MLKFVGDPCDDGPPSFVKLVQTCLRWSRPQICENESIVLVSYLFVLDIIIYQYNYIWKYCSNCCSHKCQFYKAMNQYFTRSHIKVLYSAMHEYLYISYNNLIVSDDSHLKRAWGKSRNNNYCVNPRHYNISRSKRNRIISIYIPPVSELA